MAFFGVTVETISEVKDHPGADRLSIAQVSGLAFQFVIAKNQFAVGDHVLYIPIDSLVPPTVTDKLGLTGKLTGKNKDRVKSIKLRGYLSQGLVASPEKLLPVELRNATSEEITAFLGITKYEPPVNISTDGILTELPSGYSKYDIEGADRYTSVVDLLMDQEVVVMEKMEGTNFSAGYALAAPFVNQRSNQIVEKPDVVNSYWEAARQMGLLTSIPKDQEVCVYAELCGPSIQKNIYALKKHTLYVFDVKVNYRWLNYEEFKVFMQTYLPNQEVAPVLFVGKLRDFLNGKTVQEMSNGMSVVNPGTLREGIVIKPLVEQRHPEIGRLIIKQRSPEYLVNEE